MSIEAEKEDRATWIYPENALTVEIFFMAQTQWHKSMDGPTGLIYSEVRGLMDELGITKRNKRLDVLAGIQTMEAVALGVWAERRVK